MSTRSVQSAKTLRALPDSGRSIEPSAHQTSSAKPHTPQEPSARAQVAFRKVNVPGSPDYDQELQRHHILPRQLLSARCFSALFQHIDRRRVGFDDFRSNGLLLPSTEEATYRTGMPLHRGPHRRYNELVIERVGRIEAQWIKASKTNPEAARNEALMRLRLVQIALRRRLLDERKRMVLNKKDPLGTGFDFTELDAMAESLWASTDAT